MSLRVHDMDVCTHLSACNIKRPVIRCVGMSPESMSTVRICDVIESIPPFLYKSCLFSYIENV